MPDQRKNTFKDVIADERGSAAVEFGLVAIAFVTILFAIIESGRLYLSWNGFQYSVEKAAREAIVDDDITANEVQTLVDNQLGSYWMDPDKATLTVTFPSSNGVNFIEIDGQYTYSTIVPFLPDNWSNFDLKAKARLARQ